MVEMVLIRSLRVQEGTAALRGPYCTAGMAQLKPPGGFYVLLTMRTAYGCRFAILPRVRRCCASGCGGPGPACSVASP